MKTHALLLCMMLAVGALAPPTAGADSISYTQTCPLDYTNWSKPISVPQFDPALGTLQSIDVSMAAHVEGTAFFENMTYEPATVTSVLSAEVQLSNGAQLSASIPVLTMSEEVAGFDGVLDFAGDSGRTHPGLSADKTETSTLTDAYSLALFTGDGAIDLTVKANGRSVISGPGSLTAGFQTRASAVVTVTYFYSPAPASIGDLVWNDTNGNGVYEPADGEAGINDVLVELRDADGAIITTTYTANNPATGDPGWYLFEGLTPGVSYTVAIAGSNFIAGGTLSGFVQTYDLDATLDNQTDKSLDAGEVFLDADFGYRQLCSIGDRVWQDLNGDGVQDAGEPGINGVVLTLKDSGGNVVGTATTSGDGIYVFAGLQAGTYTVSVDASTLPAGLSQTYDLDGVLDNSATVTLVGGDNRTDVDFGYAGGAPGVSLVKTGPATANVGDTITYHFKVTNTGNTYLYDVTVNDPLLGGVIWEKASMAPGEVAEFDRTFVVTSASLTASVCRIQCLPSPPSCPSNDKLVNTATVTGYSPTGSKVTATASCTTTITVTPPCQFRTYTQGGWGSRPCGGNPGALLAAKFCKVYPGGQLTIGGRYTLTFTSAHAIEVFLPQGGTPSVLRKSLTNPVCRTAAGVFAGQVLALRLNLDFSNAGITCPGLASQKVTRGALAGQTYAQVLALAEKVLGGDTSLLPHGMSVSGLNCLVDSINNKYNH